MKRVFVVLFSLLVLLGGAYFFYFANLQPVGGKEEKEFVVNRGESTKLIAQRLAKQGLIKNEYAFLAYLKLTGQVGKLQAGSFKLSTSQSVPDLVQELRQGRVDEWVTFAEGQRREQYAQLLNEKLGLSADEFLKLTRGKEGRLFPDSYLMPNDILVPQVVKKLTDNFQDKWETIDNKTNLTQNQILILASLVEREVKVDEDRRIVAGILVKRLNNDWPLQVDATVQYAKGNQQAWWPKVTGSDLKNIDSPYNTYLYKGLTPAPICNPSLSSIKAVVDYKTSDYWYYISDQKGEIHYAETVEEHNANIRRYLE